MKPICFLGNALKALRDFPTSVRQDAGFQLDRVQRGLQPLDFKPMPSIGKGVEELRIRDEAGAFRVIYLARLKEAVQLSVEERTSCAFFKSRVRRRSGLAPARSITCSD